MAKRAATSAALAVAIGISHSGAGGPSSTHDAIRHRRRYPSVTRRTETGT